MQTAGLDVLVLVRFTELGVQLFLPITAFCCAALIPLFMSGDAVDSNTGSANVASLMRYTMSNIDEGSSKLWVPWCLSYLVLAHSMATLVFHYRSYAMLRVLHLRFGPLGLQLTTGGAPRQAIVGFKPRGWRHLKHTLLRLVSAYHMHQSDAHHVRKLLAAYEAAEAAAAAEPASVAEPAPAAAEAAAKEPAAGKVSAPEAEPLLPPADSGSKVGGSSCTAPAAWESDAILPWWLPPEHIPPAFSPEYGATGVLAGKSVCTLRKRVLASTPTGRPTWVSCERYSLLFLASGPPPHRELQRILRANPRPGPPSVHIDQPAAGSAPALEQLEQQQQQQQLARKPSGASLQGGSNDGGISEQVAFSGASAASLAAATDSQPTGAAAEAMAAQLSSTLQRLFPASFSGLVRVCNHKAADLLLVKHEAASSQRDRCEVAVAAARQQAKALGALPAEGGPDAKGNGPPAGNSCPSSKQAAKASARLVKAEAELDKWQQRTEELEARLLEAQQVAVAQPLGTAFIALFRTQDVPAMLALPGSVATAVLRSGSYSVAPCPGPDDINWPTLWCTWQMRYLRSLLVILPLSAVMLFPIGALTGALSNLNEALCGGTPETNSLYWPWYCESDSFWQHVLKALLTGVLPSILSTVWDTYALPLLFYFLAQSERRHASLSALDRRITVLFYCFSAVNTFLGNVAGSTIIQNIGSMLKQPGQWLTQLGLSLPTSSSFFINYAIIHGLCINVFRFVWPHDGTVLFVLFRAVGLFRPKCERDHCMIRSTPSYRAGRHFGAFLLLQMMGFAFAVIAPLILPPVAVFFFTAWLAWRYCALHFYERSYESGGRIFEILFELSVWSLGLFSTFTALVFASKKSWTASILLVATQLPMLGVFHRRVTLTTRHLTHGTMQLTIDAPTVELDPAVFVPPPLRPRAVGWYPEWGKVWEKYGISRYSW
ncbi:ERD4-related membrane [Chlorella sorokiniana]|uniref:ERD4-related membrane n=1 Tax=Chlorella sorokiniana TaxID=3076 RepID=A0A2P6TB50_CHLSO|nr:ERD4-related membrane [Chlorella sorokiniana]|eukprot:PRW05771.1 ERD4-related membrane [Chlorella sorokiniana]